MKKSFYLAALAVAALSSCSSDVAVNPNTAQEEALVPIELGIGTPLMTVTTRGAGTIGSTEVAENLWHNERVRVLMTWILDEAEGITTWGYSTRTDENETYDLFGNQFYCLPDESAPTYGEEHGVALIPALPEGERTRYYPANSKHNSNFFAYFVDDAIATREDGAPDVEDHVGIQAIKIILADMLASNNQH